MSATALPKIAIDTMPKDAPSAPASETSRVSSASRLFSEGSASDNGDGEDMKKFSTTTTTTTTKKNKAKQIPEGIIAGGDQSFSIDQSASASHASPASVGHQMSSDASLLWQKDELSSVASPSSSTFSPINKKLQLSSTEDVEEGDEASGDAQETSDDTASASSSKKVKFSDTDSAEDRFEPEAEPEAETESAPRAVVEEASPEPVEAEAHPRGLSARSSDAMRHLSQGATRVSYTSPSRAFQESTEAKTKSAAKADLSRPQHTARTSTALKELSRGASSVSFAGDSSVAQIEKKEEKSKGRPLLTARTTRAMQLLSQGATEVSYTNKNDVPEVTRSQPSVVDDKADDDEVAGEWSAHTTKLSARSSTAMRHLSEGATRVSYSSPARAFQESTEASPARAASPVPPIVLKGEEARALLSARTSSALKHLAAGASRVVDCSPARSEMPAEEEKKQWENTEVVIKGGSEARALLSARTSSALRHLATGASRVVDYSPSRSVPQPEEEEPEITIKGDYARAVLSARTSTALKDLSRGASSVTFSPGSSVARPEKESVVPQIVIKGDEARALLSARSSEAMRHLSQGATRVSYASSGRAPSPTRVSVRSSPKFDRKKAADHFRPQHSARTSTALKDLSHGASSVTFAPGTSLARSEPKFEIPQDEEEEPQPLLSTRTSTALQHLASGASRVSYSPSPSRS